MEEEEILENNFFLDPKMTPQEAEKFIVKWMSDQVDALRFANFSGKLSITARKLK